MVNAIKYRSMAAKHHRFAGTSRSPQSREEHPHLEKQLLAFADRVLADTMSAAPPIATLNSMCGRL
jgi:hypothetical protein